MTSDNLMPTKEKFAELARTILQSASVARHDDRLSIPYRPKVNKITGGIISTILLQQIEFYWTVNGNKPFYKFAAPCSHELYREGDSWYEELDLGRSEYEAARDKIATKIKQRVSKKAARSYKDENGRLQKPNHLVLYWTDSSLVTWYEFNTDLMNAYTLIIYHGFTEDEVLMYLDHMYGVADIKAYAPNEQDDNSDKTDDKNDNENGEKQDEDISPSKILAGNAENQRFLSSETYIDSLLESKDSNVKIQNFNSGLEVISKPKGTSMHNSKTINHQNTNTSSDNNKISDGSLNRIIRRNGANKQVNNAKDMFEDMKKFAVNYNTPNPSNTNPDSNKATSKTSDVKPKVSRKPRVASAGQIEYKEWLTAVLDLFNLSSAFTGLNYKDSTVAAYSKTAKSMRLIALEFNNRNPDKLPVEATVVREFFSWMQKKGWKDIGQKALVERFPEYLTSILDKPEDAPYRVTQLKKWISAQEKRDGVMSDEDKEKLQVLLDIEIIVNYPQLKHQIPQDELNRLERGLADGTIYNPFE